GRVRELGLREHDDRQAMARCSQRGREPRDTAAEHQKVVHRVRGYEAAPGGAASEPLPPAAPVIAPAGPAPRSADTRPSATSITTSSMSRVAPQNAATASRT